MNQLNVMTAANQFFRHHALKVETTNKSLGDYYVYVHTQDRHNVLAELLSELSHSQMTPRSTILLLVSSETTRRCRACLRTPSIGYASILSRFTDFTKTLQGNQRRF